MSVPDRCLLPSSSVPKLRAVESLTESQLKPGGLGAVVKRLAEVFVAATDNGDLVGSSPAALKLPRSPLVCGTRPVLRTPRTN